MLNPSNRPGWSPSVSYTADETAVVACARRAPDGRVFGEPRTFRVADHPRHEAFGVALLYATRLCKRLNAGD